MMSAPCARSAEMVLSPSPLQQHHAFSQPADLLALHNTFEESLPESPWDEASHCTSG